MNTDELVSIIMPTYNVENFIEETIKSVQDQIYKNWELIIVDDNSTDKTVFKIEKIMCTDHRIKLIKLYENQGAAFARNTAIKKSQGAFIAFLDSDDTWYNNKLFKQIKFMNDNEIYFCSTDYEKIDEDSNKLNVTISSPTELNYWGLLKNCPGNSTVIYNSQKIGKIYSPDIRKRNDYALWLKVIKKTEKLYGMSEVLSSHRVRENGISHDKKSLVKYHWRVYREIEKLSYFKASYLIGFWISKGVLKNITNIKMKS